MTYLLADLEDRVHPVVLAALKKRCKLCHAEKGDVCTDGVARKGEPARLLKDVTGRWVHQVRVELT